jgi:hypothetical protein
LHRPEIAIAGGIWWSDANQNNTNDGKPWSERDVFDLRSAIWLGETIEQAADFLSRSDEEVATKAKELGLSTTRH